MSAAPRARQADDELFRFKVEQSHAYLERVRRMLSDLEGTRAIIESARDSLDLVKGIDYSKPSTSGTASDDAFVNAIIRLQHSIEGYVIKVAECEDARHEANAVLERLQDGSQAQCLRLHYLLNVPWNKVTERMSMSYDGVMSLRKRSLASVYDVMPKEIPKAL